MLCRTLDISRTNPDSLRFQVAGKVIMLVSGGIEQQGSSFGSIFLLKEAVVHVHIRERKQRRGQLQKHHLKSEFELPRTLLHFIYLI